MSTSKSAPSSDHGVAAAGHAFGAPVRPAGAEQSGLPPRDGWQAVHGRSDWYYRGVARATSRGAARLNAPPAHEPRQPLPVRASHTEPLEMAPARQPRPHVLVCIRGDDLDLELMRQGDILAGLLNARLTVIHAFSLGEGTAERRVLTRDRAYAVARGAVFVEVPAYSPADGIVEYAQTRGVTHLVLGDTGSAPWYAGRRNALPQQLLKRLAGIDLYFVAEPETRQ